MGPLLGCWCALALRRIAAALMAASHPTCNAGKGAKASFAGEQFGVSTLALIEWQHLVTTSAVGRTAATRGPMEGRAMFDGANRLAR